MLRVDLVDLLNVLEDVDPKSPKDDLATLKNLGRAMID